MSDKSFDDIFGTGDLPPDGDLPEEEPQEEPAAEEKPAEPEEAPEEEPEAPEDPEEGAGDEDEPEEEGDEKPEAKEKPEEVPRSYKVTIDGEEREVDADELVRGYQTSQASQKRFSEAKELHEEAATFFKKFVPDPGGALTDLLTERLGSRTQAREKVRDIFLEFLAPDLEEAMIQDDRERDIYRRRRALDDQDRELARREEEARARAAKKSQDEFVGQLSAAIKAGLKKEGFPEEGEGADEVWNRVAYLIDLDMKSGVDRPTALSRVPQIMKQVAAERLEAARGLIPTLTPEQLRELFPEQVEALRKERIQQVKEERSKKTPGAGTQRTQQRQPRGGGKDRGSRYKSLDEVFGGV